jgi:branched-chain amino acid transport system substrate-binding protein
VESPKVLEIAGASAEGIIYTRAAFNASTSATNVSAFVSAYKAAYGELPEVFAAQGYDNIQLLAMVLQRDGRAADDIKRGLLAVRDYPGVSGQTTFLPNGDVVKPLVFRTIRNGSFTDYTP